MQIGQKMSMPEDVIAPASVSLEYLQSRPPTSAKMVVGIDEVPSTMVWDALSSDQLLREGQSPVSVGFKALVTIQGVEVEFQRIEQRLLLRNQFNGPERHNPSLVGRVLSSFRYRGFDCSLKG